MFGEPHRHFEAILGLTSLRDTVVSVDVMILISILSFYERILFENQFLRFLMLDNILTDENFRRKSSTYMFSAKFEKYRSR